MVLSDQSLSDVKVPAQLVEGIVQTGDWQYVQSSNRNAYPDSGIKDGYEYEYLRIPLDNAVTAPKIATGSYTGTGTKGASNPTSLTFSFSPKFLVVLPINGVYRLIFVRGVERSNTSPNGHSYGDVAVAWGGSTVSWYTTDSNAGVDFQLNVLNTKYFYFAVG